MNTASMLYRYIKNVFPMVDAELDMWKKAALSIPDGELSRQAAHSIDKKGFHVRGGSAFSLYPGVDIPSLVKLIAAYQTISDYLDNLCDRAGVEDDTAFGQLHLSMADALEVDGDFHDYYLYYPYKDDGGYLLQLVKTCRYYLSKLPSYHTVSGSCLKLAGMYSTMQSYKHMPYDMREEKLFGWAMGYRKEYPMIETNEFCAAAGSTLGIFMLFAAASSPSINKSDIEKIEDAYFPWICGLHILLDYLIDYYEDISNNELNFVMYYNNNDTMVERIKLFVDNSLKCASGLEHPVFHKTIVYGLLSMYLSDPKALSHDLFDISNSIINRGSMKLKLMHKLCVNLRTRMKI